MTYTFERCSLTLLISITLLFGIEISVKPTSTCVLLHFTTFITY